MLTSASQAGGRASGVTSGWVLLEGAGFILPLALVRGGPGSWLSSAVPSPGQSLRQGCGCGLCGHAVYPKVCVFS